MIDIKFLRENPDAVRENIKKKFQDAKLPLVDEVIEYDAKSRAAQQEADQIRADKKKISKQIGILMKQGKKEEAQAIKDQVADNSRLDELDKIKKEADEIVRKDMMLIPQIIDPSVPLGPDDSCNVEIEKFGEPVVPDFEVPYHTDIMKRFNGIDLDAAGDGRCRRQRFLLSDGQHRKTSLRSDFLCQRFHDQQGIHLLCASFHDPQPCRHRRYELCRDGCHDVQD